MPSGPSRAAALAWIVLAGLAGAPGVLAQSPRPEVHVIATGGTIAFRDAAAPLTVEQLVAAMPGVDRIAAITVEQLTNIPSSRIRPAHWLQLARRIDELFRARPRLRGIVVTHGTDTMEETALFLHLTIADERPVVVTGAMRSPGALGADGPANLWSAIRVASASSARGRGTMVAMNDQIFSAADVTKRHTSRPDAFVAASGGAVGGIVADAVRFAGPPAPRGARFDVTAVEDLPRVDIAYVWAGADGAAIDAFVAAGARGIVLASVGQGNLPESLAQAAVRAAQRGVVLALSSRVGAGTVSAPADAPASIVGAGSFNPQRARVMLMLALTRTEDPREIARLYNQP
jgi:L-asparaginase type II